MKEISFGITKKKSLYEYQQKDINQIFERIDKNPVNYNLLYQLPTGGGKTVVFSNITQRYIRETSKKVLILTHRIELCDQTSRMLKEFEVPNKIINSKIKELPDQDEYNCFVAMVETLNNRLNEDKLELEQIGLIIIDEAHYNSFRKLFKFFENCFILGVTATPLSSNVKLPMKESYDELLVGETISELIKKRVLAKAITYNHDIRLGALKVGMNGDYTVKSSEELYTNSSMLHKLQYAYEERAKNTKTLIFNNGITTSIFVADTFNKVGYPTRHLDNTHGKTERKEILEWFKKTPNAILSSVSILTTGFDEPSIETIIINRATKSLTLYFQMIGRGSRVLPSKSEFTVIDLGNNFARFGPWESEIDWQKIFKSPDFYINNLISDEEIEKQFRYKMSEELRARFKNTLDIEFDVKRIYKQVMSEGSKSKVVLEKSIAQHSQMCVENSEDVFDARELAKLLKDDIEYRIRQYCFCIINNTKNYKDWLQEDYMRKLRLSFNNKFN